MRVLLVNLGLVPGLAPHDFMARLPGIGRFVEALAQAGVRVTVLARAEEPSDHGEGNLRLVTVADGGAALPPLLSPVTAVVARARRLEPDVVHFGGLVFPVPVVALRAALPRRVPVLLQHHGEPPGAGRLGVLQKRCLRSADGVLFTAAEIALDWMRGGHLPWSTPVHEVLEASTDLRPSPRAEARERTGVDGDPAVLWVGRLHPRKDPVTALRAFEGALARLPGARLHVVWGDAPLLGELRGIVERSPSLAGTVRFAGRVPHHELHDWYSAADLFLTTSPAEGSNWALIEATACGLPAVASDIPANRRVTGDLSERFPPGDAAAGTEAIVKAAARAGEPWREKLRARFETELTWEAVAQEAKAAYAAAIARRRTS